MRLACAIALILTAPLPAWGWSAHGHRMITTLALEGLPAEAPAWLRASDMVARAAYQSNEVDRWRGWRSPTLAHINEPNHYLDIDLLEQFGLTLDSLPRLRGEYLRALILAKDKQPERVAPYDAEKDAARSKEWPGFVVHASREHYAALQASLHQVRILEKLADPARAGQMAQSQANAIYHLGALSHFIGDMAQPLHTTRHYNGWIGENPNGYTTANTFHAKIDGGAIDAHRIEIEDVRPLVRVDRGVNPDEPWPDIVMHLRRSHEHMEPLYVLERDNLLAGPAGRAFLCERLADGAGMLSALVLAAWQSSAPTPKQEELWLFYDTMRPGLLESATQSAPASAPAAPN